MSINLYIVTGFLGSGKTTLVKNIHKQIPDHNFHYIINEAGEVAIDQALYNIEKDESSIVYGGCACCVKKSELIETIKEYLHKNGNIVNRKDTIIIETSGLANPAPIVFSIKSDPYIKHHIHVAGIICVISSIEGILALENYNEVVQQVAMSDVVILSKAELAKKEEKNQLKLLITRKSPGIKIYQAANGNVNWQELFQYVISDQRTQINNNLILKERSSGNVGHNKTTTCLISYEGSIDWVAFGVWLSALLHRHGEYIMRVKGTIQVKDWQNDSFFILINGVQHIMYPPQHVKYQNLPNKSLLVFILNGINPQQISLSFDRFMHKYSEYSVRMIST